MSDTFGPYQHARDMVREPLFVDLADLRTQTGTNGGDPDRLEFGLRHKHLIDAVERAGIEIGVADRRGLRHLAEAPASVVQVLIGLLSRANQRP